MSDKQITLTNPEATILYFELLEKKQSYDKEMTSWAKQGNVHEVKRCDKQIKFIDKLLAKLK